jgi:hypothetical protein
MAFRRIVFCFQEAMPPSSGEAQPRSRKNISVIGMAEPFRTSGGEAAVTGSTILGLALDRAFSLTRHIEDRELRVIDSHL